MGVPYLTSIGVQNLDVHTKNDCHVSGLNE